MTELQYVRIHMEVLKNERLAYGPQAVADLVKRHGLHTQAQEAFWVIAHGGNGNIHNIAEVGRGRHDEVSVDIPSLLTAVLATGAPSFSVAHNHPSMSAEPSYADRNMTNVLMTAANACGLVFEDHVIVEPLGRHFSFADAGMIIGKKKRGATAVAQHRDDATKAPDGLVACAIHATCDRSFRPGSAGIGMHEARVGGIKVASAARSGR